MKKLLTVMLAVMVLLAGAGCSGRPVTNNPGKPEYYGKYRLIAIGGKAFEQYQDYILKTTSASLCGEGVAGTFVIDDESCFEFNGQKYPVKVEKTEDGKVTVTAEADSEAIMKDRFGSTYQITIENGQLVCDSVNGEGFFYYENVVKQTMDPADYYGEYTVTAVRHYDDTEWEDPQEFFASYGDDTDFWLRLAENGSEMKLIDNAGTPLQCEVEMDYEVELMKACDGYWWAELIDNSIIVYRSFYVVRFTRN